jgi:xanthine dehydrogenase accessory factor
MTDVWEIIAQQQRDDVSCVAVTIIGVRGSVPGQLGGKAVVTSEGMLTGNLGGGRVEAKAIVEAQRLLQEGCDDCIEHCWNLQTDVGMTCGGEMRFLFEPIPAQVSWHIVIFGAGHVVQALVANLTRLRCRVDVIDTRAEWLERLPAVENITTHLVANNTDGVKLVTEQSYVLSLSKGHMTDRPVLRDLLQKDFSVPYLGVIGSAAKRAVLLRELREDGVAEKNLKSIICPVGLPIGTNDPEEIAISIVAQLLEMRDD